VCRVECLFSSQLAPVPIYTAWWTEADLCEQLDCFVKRSGWDLNLRLIGWNPNSTSWIPVCVRPAANHESYVNVCPFMKFGGRLYSLHEAGDDAIHWLSLPRLQHSPNEKIEPYACMHCYYTVRTNIAVKLFTVCCLLVVGYKSNNIDVCHVATQRNFRRSVIKFLLTKKTQWSENNSRQ